MPPTISRRALARLGVLAGAGAVTSVAAPGPAEPLLGRTSMFVPTSSGDRGSTFVCDTGGSGAPPPPRYLTWTSWQHLPSGRHVNHINSHLNAHIDDNGVVSTFSITH